MNLEDLERLARLRDSGVLTQEEFETQKANFLRADEARDIEAAVSETPRSRVAFWIAIASVLVAVTLLVVMNFGVSSDGAVEDAVNPADSESSVWDQSVQENQSKLLSQEAEQQRLEAAATKAAPPRLPSFGDFSTETTDEIAPLKIEPGSWFADYRTRISSAYAGKANFSANAVVIMWGCGTGCRFAVLIDRASGNVFDVPLGGEEQQGLGIRTQRGSNLLLANWQENSDCVFEAFVWNGAAFTSIRGFPKRVSGDCPYWGEEE